MQKCFLVIMLKLEIFKEEYKKKKEILTPFNIETFYCLFKDKKISKELLKKQKASWKEKKEIDKENAKRINFTLVLKECPNETLNKSSRRSLNSLKEKGMIEIKKQGYNIQDYVLTAKGKKIAKCLACSADEQADFK